MGIRHAKAHTLCGLILDETRANDRLGQVKTHVLPFCQSFPAKAEIMPISSPINRWQGPQEYDEEREMEPRLVRARKLLSFSIQGGRPSEFIREGNRSQGMNLPLLLAAHLGRSENGHSLQSPLTSVHGGSQPSTNIGGNLPLAILGLQEDQRISRFVHGLRTRNLVEKNRDRFSHYHGSNHGLLSNLSKSPREILAKEKLAKTFEQPLRMLGNKRSHDMTKYWHFHEDHGYDTNDCHELRHQIKEAVKSVQLSHLIKGIKKGNAAKASDTQRGEWKKGDKDTAPAEAPILMIS
ncbi:hypothetical protein Tco_0601832 [Tanacetum coccineum]